MKKKKMIIISLTILLAIVFIVPQYIYASDPIGSLITDMGSANTMPTGSTKFKNIINSVIKIIQVAGSGISLIVVTMLGVKYMMASAQEKADLKKSIVPILIGCVLLFAGANLVGIIADTASTAGLAGTSGTTTTTTGD